MFERYLVCHCAPTLASLKTANLFNISFSSREELREQLDCWNECLGKKGVSLTVLLEKERSALVYVFRRNRLQKELNCPRTASFLAGYGYQSTDADYSVRRLKDRLRESGDFPHEIGVFLGYPLGDVIGFIENKGRNCKCEDCWKVYCNECEARKTFDRFRKCRNVYVRLWQEGRSVQNLTVAA